MKIGRLAARAVGWLRGILGIFGTPAGRQFGTAILGSVLGEKAPKYIAKLEKLEKGIGAHTRVWNKVSRAKGAKTAVTLEPAEVAYLYMFKKLWDEHIKKPLKKAAKPLTGT